MTRAICWWNDVLSPDYPVVIGTISQLYSRWNSSSCPNHFWVPAVQVLLCMKWFLWH